MANVFVNDETLTAIADAIRSKNGTKDSYKPAEMPNAISAITTSSASGGVGTNETQIESYANANSPAIVDIGSYVSDIARVKYMEWAVKDAHYIYMPDVFGNKVLSFSRSATTYKWTKAIGDYELVIDGSKVSLKAVASGIVASYFCQKSPIYIRYE